MRLLLLLTALSGCSLRFDATGGTVSCATNADCPPQYSCDPDAGLCFASGDVAPAPPSVSFGVVQRQSGVIQVPIVVSDPNRDDVTLSVEWSVDGITWAAANVAQTSFVSSGKGEPAQLDWNAQADGVTSYQHAQLSVVPTDATRAQGAAAVSPAFEVGDDAPVVSMLSVGTGALSGAIPVAFMVSDSTPDLSNVEIEFRNGGEWTPAAILFGSLNGLPPGNHLVVWDSASVTGGIGARTSFVVELRMRGSDQPSTTLSAQGEWTPALVLQRVQNQTAPRVESVYIKNDGELTNGVVPIAYRVFDAESDPATIAMEYSTDGLVWNACTEFPTPRSEGRQQLATSPEGLLHVFMWESSADAYVVSPTTSVRVRASDAFGEGGSVFLQSPRRMGPANDLQWTDTSLGFDGVITTLADVNGDSNVDLIIATATLDVHAGNSDGTFAVSATSSPIAVSPSKVRTGQFSGNTFVDVVTLYAPSGLLALSIGAGNGSFAAPVMTALGGAAYAAMTVGDFTGDGLADVAVCMIGGAIKVLKGGDVLSFAPESWAPTPNWIDSGDFDGDGQLDLITQSSDQDGLYVLFGIGDGAFAVAQKINATVGIGAFAVADLNLDGRSDIVVRTTNPPHVRTLIAPQARSLDYTVASDVLSASVNPSTSGSLIAADVNGDHITDAILVDDSDTVSIFLGRGVDSVGTGELLTSLSFTLSGPSNNLSLPLLAADLNHDGADDFIARHVDTSHLTSFIAMGNRLSQQVLGPPSFYPTGINTWGMTSGDLNGDGAIEVITLNSVSRDLAVLVGQTTGGMPNGTLSARPPHQTGMLTKFGVQAVAIGDFDEDGAGDVAYLALHVLRVLSNPLEGERPALQIDLFDDPTALLATDIDGDQHTDLVVKNTASNIVVATGQGDGSFLLQPVVPACNGVPTAGGMSLVAADFNGDFRLDLAIACAGYDVAILLAQDTGGFGAANFESVTENANALAAGDVNNDGFVDLVVAGDTALYSLLGDGAGGFTRLGSSVAATAMRSVVLTDLTADGIIDVVAGNIAGELIARAGVGDGTFVASAISASVSGGAVLSVQDFNADMQPDLVATATGTRGVSLITTRREASLQPWVRTLPDHRGAYSFVYETGFLERVRQAKVVGSGALLPLSLGVRTAGDVRLTRVLGGACGSHLEAQARLSGPFTFDIAVMRTPIEGHVRVVRYVPDWTIAQPDCRDIIHEAGTYSDVPTFTLGKTYVTITTDRLGTFQVFETP